MLKMLATAKLLSLRGVIAELILPKRKVGSSSLSRAISSHEGHRDCFRFISNTQFNARLISSTQLNARLIRRTPHVTEGVS